MTGGTPPPQTQTTTQVLSPEQRQLMQLAMPGVTKFAASVPERYQGGSTIAPFDPSQVAAQEGMLDTAGTQTALARQGAGTTTNWLGPNALDVTNNPAVQGAISSATRPIQEQLLRVGLPAIRAGAEQTGNTGASRQGIAEGLAYGEAAKAMGDVGSKIALGAYNTNVDAQLKALGLLPQTTGVQTTGNLTTGQVGDVRQAMSQAQLDELVSNFNYDQYAPYLQSKDIMSLLTGLPGGSTQTVASGPQKGSPITSSVGGALSGAAAGSTFGPVGTLAGGGIGALLPWLNT
jgi:hypothetical protein